MTWTMLPYLFLPAMEFIFEQYDTGEFFRDSLHQHTLFKFPEESHVAFSCSIAVILSVKRYGNEILWKVKDTRLSKKVSGFELGGGVGKMYQVIFVIEEIHILFGCFRKRQGKERK